MNGRYDPCVGASWVCLILVISYGAHTQLEHGVTYTGSWLCDGSELFPPPP